MKKMSHEEMMEKLLKFNTPSVSNIVATYPQNPHCLGLYDPWYGKWYTDHSVCCIFPEMGRRIGYVFTMVVSILSGCRHSVRVSSVRVSRLHY